MTSNFKSQFRKLSLIFLILIFGVQIKLTAQNLVVGYYPDFIKSTLPVNKIKFENLTHIIHAFAWPESNGNISTYPGMLNPQLIEAAHNKGKKILIAFGGGGQIAGFPIMAADSATRSFFIENVIDFIFTHGYDGIDLDWEFPVSTAEGKNLTILVKELREKFDEINPDLLLTMAVSAGAYSGRFFEYSLLAEYVDWFAMMGYDFHGSWTTHSGHNAPLFHPAICSDGSSDSGIKYLTITRGIPKNKVLLGVPFYGKEFNSAALYQQRIGNVSDLRYTNIASRINTVTWEHLWDEFSKVPYLQDTAQTKIVTFDDTLSLRLKCEYALDNNLGGVMIWALGQDIYNNSQPLLESIAKAMGLTSPLSVEEFALKTSNYFLYENYPNPFNASTKIKYVIPFSGMGVEGGSRPVQLKVYDVLGNEVALLVNEEEFPGEYEVEFNGAGLASGIYFYTLISNGYTAIKKMILMK